MKTEHVVILVLAISVLISWIANACLVYYLAKKNGKPYYQLVYIAFIPFIGTFFLLLAKSVTEEIDRIFAELSKKRRTSTRADEVDSFRHMIAGKYGTMGLLALPDREDMINDTKELTTTNYLDLRKVINQN